jgi:hypothetical protein
MPSDHKKKKKKKEHFEDIKGVIRIFESKKDRQNVAQRKRQKYKQ